MIDLIYKFDSYNEFINRRITLIHVMNHWCLVNCDGNYIIDILGQSIRCSFTDETDAVAFKLRWL